ncbi:hypothetical protein SAMN05444397_10932 [Flavobacterium aquidurense]|nr:hypothetical protein [Flavobacterium frigidimaris]SDZ56787.1 hypothetical protein SAMN05444397_10932 [Flavobacterium aquidurense]
MRKTVSFYGKLLVVLPRRSSKSYAALPFLTAYDLLKTVFGETFF